MHTTSKKRHGFRVKSLHKHKELGALHFLSEKMSFWVAVFSLFAFVSGNMVGQHGWHVFWKSVMGGFDDSLIVYEGTVPPAFKVPGKDWTALGGNSYDHLFRQVPKDLLVPLPRYDSANLDSIYSADFAGGYSADHREGSHDGVDIRLPSGTPVNSIANGIVTRVGNDPSGFGMFIVIRHPNVPDPANPKKTTTLHSAYAHLSQTFVTEGLIVKKGEEIGASGMTGNASGPHLHFQIDTDEAPWHPYWPFTSAEMREAGMNFSQAINGGLHRERVLQYSINSMLYVQANYSPAAVVAVHTSGESKSSVIAKKVRMSLKDRRDARLKQRDERRIAADKSAPVAIAPSSTPAAASSSASSEAPVAIQKETMVAAESIVSGPDPVAQIEFSHDGIFNRGWEKVRVRLLDKNGNMIASPILRSDIYLRTAYGKAEFRPEILSVLDFQNGQTTIDMLPRNRGTVVIQAQPTGEMSAPMKYIDQ